MSRFWTKLTSELVPYVPGEQPRIKRITKLNTNENPYPPSPLVLLAISEELTNLRLYPDPDSLVLKETIAQYYNVSPGEVFVGNGSDEVLAHVFKAFFEGKKVLFPDITYSFYPVYSQLYNVDFREVPLKEDFTLNISDYTVDKGGIIFPNPNAPTAVALCVSEIETVLKANPDSLVVVDEAYVDFGAESCVDLIKKYDNILVVHTLSKSRSLAGLRIGFAIGQGDLVNGLERVKNSFNSYPMDRLAIVGATAAFQDDDYFIETTKKIIKSRDRLNKILESSDFQVLPSCANFVFASPNWCKATWLQSELRKHGIIVRHFSSPRINNFLRITIGTDKEIEYLYQVLQKISHLPYKAV